MIYPLEIHVWPHARVGYYSKGHQPINLFRKMLKAQHGIVDVSGWPKMQWIYGRMTMDGITPQKGPSQGTFPITVWSIA